MLSTFRYAVVSPSIKLLKLARHFVHLIHAPHFIINYLLVIYSSIYSEFLTFFRSLCILNDIVEIKLLKLHHQIAGTKNSQRLAG